MKNYAKIGKRQGRPAYRTPSDFKLRRHLKVMKIQGSIKIKSINFKKYDHENY